jgi:hypothetical protein
MITAEQNKKLTGVSAGTPLHEPLSRFWYPVLHAAQLQDRCTRKIRLLGEDFVIARNGDSLLALEEKCPAPPMLTHLGPGRRPRLALHLSRLADEPLGQGA